MKMGLRGRYDITVANDCYICRKSFPTKDMRPIITAPRRTRNMTAYARIITLYNPVFGLVFAATVFVERLCELQLWQKGVIYISSTWLQIRGLELVSLRSGHVFDQVSSAAVKLTVAIWALRSLLPNSRPWGRCWGSENVASAHLPVHYVESIGSGALFASLPRSTRFPRYSDSPQRPLTAG